MLTDKIVDFVVYKFSICIRQCSMPCILVLETGMDMYTCLDMHVYFKYCSIYFSHGDLQRSSVV